MTAAIHIEFISFIDIHLTKSLEISNFACNMRLV